MDEILQCDYSNELLQHYFQIAVFVLYAVLSLEEVKGILYGVTIQIKPYEKFFCVVGFACRYFATWYFHFLC